MAYNNKDAVICALEDAIKMGMELLKQLKGEEYKEDTLEIKVSKLLQKLGIPTHLKGYSFLRIGIIMALENPSVLESITKGFYPEVAKQCNTTPGRVERGIRNAIETSFERGDINQLQSFFGNTLSPKTGKPSNAEFISMIVDNFRLQLL